MFPSYVPFILEALITMNIPTIPKVTSSVQIFYEDYQMWIFLLYVGQDFPLLLIFSSYGWTSNKIIKLTWLD